MKVSENKDDMDQVDIDKEIVFSPVQQRRRSVTNRSQLQCSEMQDVLLNAIQSHVYIPPTFHQLMGIAKSQFTCMVHLPFV
jgi:hypothetical protein